jgi:hypothetical protein
LRTRVDLSDIWTREANDFRPWLANEENLTILGETLGIDLELEAQEKSVGPFRADILWAQNFLDPEHTEQIVSWYRAFEDVEDRAKVVTLDVASPVSSTASSSNRRP